jgi:eukaryotic translation initiation factor 2C
MDSHNGEADDLPPPPPLNACIEPLKSEETKKLLKPKRALIPRKGFGKKGEPIRLVTNHFKVSLKNTEEFFYHYYVCLLSLSTIFLMFSCSYLIINAIIFYRLQVDLKYEDDTPVGKGAGRNVIEKLQQTYATELANKDFTCDVEKSLFTIGALPQNINELTVVVEDVSTGK